MTDIPVIDTRDRIKTGDEILENLKRDLYYSFGVAFERHPKYEFPQNDPEVWVDGIAGHGVATLTAAQLVKQLEACIGGGVPLWSEHKFFGPEQKPLRLWQEEQDAAAKAERIEANKQKRAAKLAGQDGAVQGPERPSATPLPEQPSPSAHL